jgi:hypothetical protein
MTTKSQVQNYTLLNIDDSFDSQFESWVSQVTHYIETVTGRRFSVDDEPTERSYDGNGRDTLVIDEYSEMDSVTVEGDEITDFKEYPANKDVKYKLFYENKFPQGKQNVVVSARFGEAVPADLLHVATVLVAGIMQASIKTDGAITSERIGNYNVSYTDKQVEDYKLAMDTLTRYRNYSI